MRQREKSNREGLRESRWRGERKKYYRRDAEGAEKTGCNGNSKNAHLNVAATNSMATTGQCHATVVRSARRSAPSELRSARCWAPISAGGSRLRWWWTLWDGLR